MQIIKASLTKFKLSQFFYKYDKKSLDINLLGTINISQIFCEYFVKNKIKGNIINIASTYSIVAPNIALYNKNLSSIKKMNKPMDYVISKSSIPNLTRYIATNYGRQNIRANCLVPHGIKNQHKKDFIKKYSNLSPWVECLMLVK